MPSHETDYVWAEMFTQAVHDFDGQRPTAQLEHDLIQHFNRQPAELAAAIAKTATRFQQRKIHSPWPIVLRELQNADERHTIHATDTTEKHHATRLAETHIRNAALFLPTEDELLDELFGTHGRLKAWADDTHLRQRLTDIWHDQQPRADATHQASRARADAWKKHRQATHPANTTTTHTPKEPPTPPPPPATPTHHTTPTTPAAPATTTDHHEPTSDDIPL